MSSFEYTNSHYKYKAAMRRGLIFIMGIPIYLKTAFILKWVFIWNGCHRDQYTDRRSEDAASMAISLLMNYALQLAWGRNQGYRLDGVKRGIYHIFWPLENLKYTDKDLARLWLSSKQLKEFLARWVPHLVEPAHVSKDMALSSFWTFITHVEKRDFGWYQWRCRNMEKFPILLGPL